LRETVEELIAEAFSGHAQRKVPYAEAVLLMRKMVKRGKIAATKWR
jgi:hypothetical protein